MSKKLGFALAIMTALATSAFADLAKGSLFFDVGYASVSYDGDSHGIDDGNGPYGQFASEYVFDVGVKAGFGVGLASESTGRIISFDGILDYQFDNGLALDFRPGFSFLGHNADFSGVSYGLGASYRFGENGQWRVQAQYRIYDDFEYDGSKNIDATVSANAVFITIGYDASNWNRR